MQVLWKHIGEVGHMFSTITNAKMKLYDERIS